MSISSDNQIDHSQYRREIKQAIMTNLYWKQLEYWNDRLVNLSHRNAELYNRNDGAPYAIHFRNRRWAPTGLHWDDFEQIGGTVAYCLPLKPELREEMKEIADEFEALCDEKYEAERFLSNLVLFSIPPKRYRAIIGRTLYRLIQQTVEDFCQNFTDADWELNSEYSLREYVENNREIITKMNERVMINLVTV